MEEDEEARTESVDISEEESAAGEEDLTDEEGLQEEFEELIECCVQRVLALLKSNT